jgi:nitrate/TMAO reductase-like tetraheme cytochrome c subunit
VVLALAAVLWTMVGVLRGRLAGISGRGLLLVGVVLLPSFCVGTGMLLALSRASRVEFCGSCHEAIGPYVADMTDPTVTGLAGLHFRYRYIPSNQCYECHTSYGLFGSVEAKVHGIRQVLRYYAGDYRAPITMWKPYSNADCLKCHAASRAWLDREAHTDGGMDRKLFENRVSCMECHASGHGALGVAREARR